MTTRRRASRIRNHTKMRLMGVVSLRNLLYSQVLSTTDKNRLGKSIAWIEEILDNWDKGYISKLSDEDIKAIVERGY